MKRDTYLRLTVLKVPANTLSGYLFLLAMVSRPVAVHEGFLVDDVRVCERIRLKGRRLDMRARFATDRVTRIEDGFALTANNNLYQVCRVPAPISDKQ